MKSYASFAAVVLVAIAGIVGLVLAFGHSDHAPRPRDPVVVGSAVGDFYNQMIGETAQAVAQATSPAALSRKVGDIRDRYTDLFVNLGREREQFGASDRQSADNAEYSRMLQVRESGLQTIRRYAASHEKTDPALAGELEKLLRLETYANFEQLRAGDPQAALRVGAK